MNNLESNFLRNAAFAWVLIGGICIVFQIGSARDRDSPPLHRNIACARCHTLSKNPLANAAKANATLSAKVDAEVCKDCHSSLKSETDSQLNFHDNPERACVDCHAFHSTKQIGAGLSTFQFSFESPETEALCTPCHGKGKTLERVNAAHRDASQVYHQDFQKLRGLSPSEACLTCHSNQTVIFASSLSDKPAPRFNPHASHVFGVSISASHSSGGYFERLPDNDFVKLVDGKIECQTCHDLTSSLQALLPVLPVGSGLCTACHVRNQ